MSLAREPSQDESLPQDVIEVLRHARYLHLGTSCNDFPHVSLMNFLHVPAGSVDDLSLTGGDAADCVALICSRRTKKYFNIVKNPRVSLLVHDWSTRASHESTTGGDKASDEAGGFSDRGLREGGLASLLSALNAAALSKHSVTLSGTAEVVSDPVRAAFFRERMKGEGTRAQWSQEDVKCWVESDDTDVVLVHLGSARISDRGDHVHKWKQANALDTPSSAGHTLTNDNV
ncbi:hypothetical protein PYCC9005_001934 [Savitreella phatthalungensis]